MKRVLTLAILPLLAIVVVLATPTMAVDLIADGGEPPGIVVGEVTVSVSVGSLYVDGDGNTVADATLSVVFDTDDTWELMEAHLAAGKSLSDIPQTGKGNPKVGNFEEEWEAENTSEASDAETLTIIVKGLPAGQTTTIYIGAHAEVVILGPDGDDEDEYPDIVQEETAWGAGEEFNVGRNWATYFTEDVDVTVLAP